MTPEALLRAVARPTTQISIDGQVVAARSGPERMQEIDDMVQAIFRQAIDEGQGRLPGAEGI